MADDKPIIIKKVYKKGGDGHHGGAWKVAYADFVTAMMAFFLLMWLLNVATEEQLAGLANYFSPISASNSQSGSGGVLGGLSLSAEGALVSQAAPVGAAPQNAADGDVDVVDDDEDLGDAEMLENGAVTQSQFEKMKAEEEQEMFAAAKAELQQAIEGIPELQDLANNLIVDQTPEGLRIQIIDQAGNSMFPLGSAKMYDKTYNLLAKVSEVVKKLPNKISIRGHTDSVKYSPNAEYNNWDLSADRANASRRALEVAGLDPTRIYNVVGKADKEHLFPDDPTSPQNRRISIVLLRDNVLRSGMEATGKPGTTSNDRPSWEVDPMTRKWNKPFLRNR